MNHTSNGASHHSVEDFTRHSALRGLRPLGGGDEVIRATELESLGYAMPTIAGGGAGLSGRTFNRGPLRESKPSRTESHASTSFNSGSARGAIVFFRDLRRAFQRGKQGRE